MTIQVSTQDQRTAKALELLASADRWLKITSKVDGRRYYVVPSSDGQHVYWVRPDSCTCPDATRRGLTCKHRIAAALFVARVNADRKQPKRTLCAGCNGTSLYHMARCGRVRVPLLGRVCA